MSKLMGGFRTDTSHVNIFRHSKLLSPSAIAIRTYGIRQDEYFSAHPRTPRAPGNKRTVALHIGYVGTAFKGLSCIHAG